MTEVDESNLKFMQFISIIDPTFWHKLSQVKLEIDKLQENEREIFGFYINSDAMCMLVDYSSFNTQNLNRLNTSQYTTIEYLCNNDVQYATSFVRSFGRVINFNSLKSFKELDKNKFIEKCGRQIGIAIESGEAIRKPELLVQFFIITFADLKTYEFIYWFAFPALSTLSYQHLHSAKDMNTVFSSAQIQKLLRSHRNLPESDQVFFMFEVDGENSSCKSLEYYINRINSDNTGRFYLCMLDPSYEIRCPGWPLRNLLALIAYHRKSNEPVNVICLRIGSKFKTSFVLKLQIEGEYDGFKWIGWERNTRNKYGPKKVNLKNSIDPIRLAESSVDLNLKLMKWRLAPELDLLKINSQKCLLLGAGTLGCSVARCLMAWGIRHITFVDNGRVSFSNPVRQSLYNYDNCDLGQGAQFKAFAAAEALKKIFPSMKSSGIILEIPMPGHPTANFEHALKLHDLIECHDCVFLLTDSRESRWLPTVIASVLDKVAITAALGFDTYMVMRHGRQSNKNSSKLGCYFCNDVTAPGNSMLDRTLDQQCTVTRPGVSYIASSLAVEIYISLLQHNVGASANPDEESVLGIIPHSVRGFLSHYNQITPATTASGHCIACSDLVKEEYVKNRNDFLKKVFESNTYLEDLTGLTEIHKLAESIEIVELSDEEESV
ncbi:autophagy-related 7 isoform X2 [Rhodnius prolixus]